MIPGYVISRGPAFMGQVPATAPAGQVSTSSIGVTTGSEPGSPAPGLPIFGWDSQGRPLDASGNVLSSAPTGIAPTVYGNPGTLSSLPGKAPAPYAPARVPFTSTTNGKIVIGVAAVAVVGTIAYLLLKD